MSLKRIASLSLVTLSALSTLGSVARADYQFTYKSFDPPAPAGGYALPYANSQAFGLSNTGAVAGVYGDSSGITLHGYIYQNGAYTTLNYTGATTGTITSPNAINSAGVVTGYYLDTRGNESDFIYRNGAFSSPAHANAPGGTVYQGVNDAGQVAAQYVDAASIAHASIYNVNTGLFADLPDTPASLGTNTFLQSVAVSGDYIANYVDSNGNTQGLVHRNGGYTSLMFPGAETTRADAINSSGLIAGRYFKNNFANEGGFLYDNGTFYDIAFPGALLTDVEFGLNDSNQIAGYYEDQNNVFHSFTAQATDVPEPSACALLIAGGFAATAFLRRLTRFRLKA